MYIVSDASIISSGWSALLPAAAAVVRYHAVAVLVGGCRSVLHAGAACFMP
jgi:hypothetical protein